MVGRENFRFAIKTQTRIFLTDSFTSDIKGYNFPTIFIQSHPKKADSIEKIEPYVLQKCKVDTTQQSHYWAYTLRKP